MDWLDDIVDIVNKAAERAELPPRPVAFDGESWVWIWRELEGQNLPGVPEALARAQPDVMFQGIETTIAAGAWMREHRNISIGRTIYTRYIPLNRLRLAPEQLTVAFAQHLRNARETARYLASQLPAIKEQREAFRQSLDDPNSSRPIASFNSPS